MDDATNTILHKLHGVAADVSLVEGEDNADGLGDFVFPESDADSDATESEYYFTSDSEEGNPWDSADSIPSDNGDATESDDEGMPDIWG